MFVEMGLESTKYDMVDYQTGVLATRRLLVLIPVLPIGVLAKTAPTRI